MAAQELRNYLENGNISNSVNLPNLAMRRSGECRICVIHKNVPTILSSIVNLVSDLEINVENLINKSKKDLAYTMIDINQSVGENMVAAIQRMEPIHSGTGAPLSTCQQYHLKKLLPDGGSFWFVSSTHWQKARFCGIVGTVRNMEGESRMAKRILLIDAVSGGSNPAP